MKRFVCSLCQRHIGSVLNVRILKVNFEVNMKENAFTFKNAFWKLYVTFLQFCGNQLILYNFKDNHIQP